MNTSSMQYMGHFLHLRGYVSHFFSTLYFLFTIRMIHNFFRYGHILRGLLPTSPNSLVRLQLSVELGTREAKSEKFSVFSMVLTKF